MRVNAEMSCGELVAPNATLDDFRVFGDAIGQELRDGDVILMSGELGAGKTTLTKEIAKGLGETRDVVSPTFNIACIYTNGRINLNHLDLYRLDGADQLDDVDFWNLVDDSTPGATVVEWAELFEDEMPEDALTITVDYMDEDAEARKIQMMPGGPRSQELLDAVLARVCG
ncbi:MAG: tRNA (adenosine(37)-N6)-threonylcarbamoyltransferase complex ATPase subunit type 1 TsaE [Eggerthellaceae bacterium]|nr:tRNA (adenosine(37)-N6)-threonylcarbamoyltransferase complex ATPase subunit type 1 TsaE [Eggerthellaceae bacterium]